ncbi:hypothetical protein [Sphingobium sp. TomTYG75]
MDNHTLDQCADRATRDIGLTRGQMLLEFGDSGAVDSFVIGREADHRALRQLRQFAFQLFLFDLQLLEPCGE